MIEVRGHKRSVTIRGHRTSVSVEPEFWDALAEIARGDGRTVSETIASIDAGRTDEGLSAAMRLYVLKRLRETVRNRQGA